jgi:hypothetical protein
LSPLCGRVLVACPLSLLNVAGGEYAAATALRRLYGRRLFG